MPVQALTPLHSVSDFQHYFPKWDWTPPPSFPSKASFDPCVELRPHASINKQQWSQGLDFFHKISWCQDPAKKTAFVELAFYAWDSGWRFDDIPEKIAAYSSFLRKACNQAIKSQQEPIVPGDFISNNKSLGKTLPSGYVNGAWPDTPISSLKKLAIHRLSGRTQSLVSWDVEF